jgi:hypothetical protein
MTVAWSDTRSETEADEEAPTGVRTGQRWNWARGAVGVAPVAAVLDHHGVSESREEGAFAVPNTPREMFSRQAVIDQKCSFSRSAPGGSGNLSSSRYARTSRDQRSKHPMVA